MKKLLLSLLLALPLCGFAQKRIQGMGVDLGIGVNWDAELVLSPSFNYQRYLSDRFRLSASLGLFYTNNYYVLRTFINDTWLDEAYLQNLYYCHMATDIHYFFSERQVALRPYAVGGVFLEVGSGGENISEILGGLKLGIGVDYKFGYRWAARLEAPLSFLIGAGVAFVPTLGIAYIY